jgi:hypothetical protein
VLGRFADKDKMDEKLSLEYSVLTSDLGTVKPMLMATSEQ